MNHYPVDDTDPTSAAHWATGYGLAGPGECHDPILVQISNARGDQVRIPLQEPDARTLQGGLQILAFATAGTSLRVPVRQHRADMPASADGDGFAIYALTDGRVRLDFHWQRQFTALVMDRTPALALAGQVGQRVAELPARAADAGRASGDAQA